MKRIIGAFLFAVVLLCSVVGCSKSAESNESSGRLSIVATIFPEYDWVMNILGDRASDVDVTMLLDSGVDLHSYQPTANDIVRISRCDLFIYVGGESDEWVEDVLKESTNRNMVVINLLELLGSSVKVEEVKEGMEAEEEGEEEGEEEYDEHVWLSLRNAAEIVRGIASALSSIDAENSEAYQENATKYIGRLNDMDARYKAVADNSSSKVLLFGDRFPFRYLVDDYGLDYYAAFAGCSAESEASFETIAFLAGKVDQLGLSSVFTLEGARHRIAETIVSTTAAKSAKILTLDSMQSTTSRDVKNGATYLSIMEKNLSVLTEALK